jgi:hypothetical protein
MYNIRQDIIKTSQVIKATPITLMNKNQLITSITKGLNNFRNDPVGKVGYWRKVKQAE